MVELVSDQAARGKKSLHLRAQNNMAYVSTRKPFPIAGNTYWARMFVRVARFSTVSYAHWTMAEAAGKGDGSLIRVGGQYASNVSQNRWGVGSDSGPTGDWTRHDADPAGKPVQPAINAWVCPWPTEKRSYCKRVIHLDTRSKTGRLARFLLTAKNLKGATTFSPQSKGCWPVISLDDLVVSTLDTL